MGMALLRKFHKQITISAKSGTERALALQFRQVQGSSTMSSRQITEIKDLRQWKFPIRNQGRKPHCWAHAVTTCVEIFHSSRTKKETILSPESVIHRLGTTSNYTSTALTLIWVKGIYLQDDWPNDATVPNNYFAEKVYIPGVKIIIGEEAIKQELDQGRPVACTVADHKNLQCYKGGILGAQGYYGAKCPKKAQCSKKICKVESVMECANKECPYKICNKEEVWSWCKMCGYGCEFHSMCIIGYGITEDNQVYWILQNSWGEEWGENGLIRVLKDRNVLRIGSIQACVPEEEEKD